MLKIMQEEALVAEGLEAIAEEIESKLAVTKCFFLMITQYTYSSL